jgi:hypothetical protein
MSIGSSKVMWCIHAVRNSISIGTFFQKLFNKTGSCSPVKWCVHFIIGQCGVSAAFKENPCYLGNPLSAA